MSRLRRDIDDDYGESFFDREEAKARDDAAAERAARAEQQGLDRAAEDASIAARSAKLTAESNARAIADEYRRAGVEPLKVDGAGVPTCSLSLLLSMGWTIGETPNGKKLLVAPPPEVHKPLPPKECT